MKNILVIVESPGKIKKIEEYLNLLGDYKYIVKASYGHCRDLDSKTLSIDVEDNFKPNYKIIPGKERIVKELKALKKDCYKVILAADEDREGEMIAESVKELLGLKNPERIVFHEITKNAIHEAVKNPKTINYDMVHAQQTRRLFDRLVGYKITPLLWKKISGMSSAGRVQSVVVKVVIDKEKEINDSIANPFYKTSAKFTYNKNKFNGVLQSGKELYKFDSEKDSEDFLNTIHVDDKFKVVSSDTKESRRKPSAPFITSTLQQEASTKLHFAVKRTMDAAQKLYEAGFITYMRTDSTNLSETAIQDCKKLIVKTFGKEYSDPKNHNKNSVGAQEAHEAIRPTNVETESTEGKLHGDSEKLYKLIRNRTLASQMSDALLDIQTIKIDVINKSKKSRLPKGTLFVSSFENIKFEGFLILYNDKNDDSETASDTMKGTIDIKVDSTIKNKEINIIEEYSKLPLRYNEAGLIKYLEKNGIGRPSTYASIISKVIDKQYVEVKCIDGTKKKSIQMCLKNSKTEIEISKSTKDIVVGKESKKMVPTDIGNQVNDFLVENFDPIMKIDFTSNFEKYLDKVAGGEAKWFNVLDKFYGLFSPIVKEIEQKIRDEPTGNTDIQLGVDEEGREIFKGSSKFGPYVKVHDGEKWKFAPNKMGDKIKIADAIALLKFPINLGKIGKADLLLNKGQYGYYLKCGTKKISVKDTTKTEDNIDFAYAKTLLDSGDAFALKSFKLKEKTLNIKKGPYGFYIQIVSDDKKKKTRNVGIPQEASEEVVNGLTLENVLAIIGIK